MTFNVDHFKYRNYKRGLKIQLFRKESLEELEANERPRQSFFCRVRECVGCTSLRQIRNELVLCFCSLSFSFVLFFFFIIYLQQQLVEEVAAKSRLSEIKAKPSLTYLWVARRSSSSRSSWDVINDTRESHLLQVTRRYSLRWMDMSRTFQGTLPNAISRWWWLVLYRKSKCVK